MKKLAAITILTATCLFSAYQVYAATQDVPVTAHISSEVHVCSADSGELICDKKETCTEFGSYYRVYRCIECREEISRAKVMKNPLGHTWDNSWVFKYELTSTTLSSEIISFINGSENPADIKEFTVGDSIYARYCTRAKDAYEVKIVHKELPSEPKPEKPVEPEKPVKPEPVKPEPEKPSAPSPSPAPSPTLKCATIRGTIRDENSDPVKQAEVALTNDDTSRVSLTDVYGTFEMADVPIGEYKLSVSLKGSTVASVDINVTESASTAKILDKQAAYDVSTYTTGLDITVDVDGKYKKPKEPNDKTSPKTGQESNASTLLSALLTIVCLVQKLHKNI